jgi:hypothetical protein
MTWIVALMTCLTIIGVCHCLGIKVFKEKPPKE